ncbi:endonuclease VII domain-containing protein [Actinomadura roseirufa]|uniref:endonuclease VII domain-containing protein n=1 Tax=Actinomadura roseirufa TaxID=2094049 RepID=UPI001041185C|nr:endonuclease VII domain-containing protein [Actinomadura roseirufa]
MSRKKCRDCGVDKPFSEFWKRKASEDGFALYCKECFGLRNSATYRKKQKEAGNSPRVYRRHSAVPEGMKYCARCGETKPLGDFGSNRSARSGLATYCKPCHNEAMAEIKRRNHGSERNYLLKLRYGLTEERLGHMLARQGGVCVICLRRPAEHVDHSHLTGVVRGVLCFRCNGGLGQFHDDPRCLGDAADYLELRGPHARRMTLELGQTTIDGHARRRAIISLSGTRLRLSGSPRQNHLRHRYGISDEDARWLLEVQRGLCAICGDVPAEHVDHDHATGAVRGMACGGCNTGMGQLGDDPVSLRRAADYLLGKLVVEVPVPGGGTRLSFTVPDVDPASVPVDGWEAQRAVDGRHRAAVWRVEDDHEGPTWLGRALADLMGSYRAIAEEYERSRG